MAYISNIIPTLFVVVFFSSFIFLFFTIVGDGDGDGGGGGDNGDGSGVVVEMTPHDTIQWIWQRASMIIITEWGSVSMCVFK